jgi:PIN domain nuclease of toxin-antitoxin system
LILIDTHIWVWWESNPRKLNPRNAQTLATPGQKVAVSVISCWEIAKLVEYGRLTLDRPVQQWIDAALARPGLELLAISPSIAVESTRLPPPFHRDPADQLIVATARVHDLQLMSEDSRILNYSHVSLA